MERAKEDNASSDENCGGGFVVEVGRSLSAGTSNPSPLAMPDPSRSSGEAGGRDEGSEEEEEAPDEDNDEDDRN